MASSLPAERTCRKICRNMQVKNVEPAEVQILYLSHRDLNPKEILSEEFTSLYSLHINNIGLESLEGFPTLKNVLFLNLDTNNLSGGLEEVVKVFPKLMTLSVRNNSFEHVGAFRPLQKASNIRTLLVYGNPVLRQKDWEKRLLKLVDKIGFTVSVAPSHETLYSSAS